MNIRSRLRALILATLLPVAVFGIAGAYLLVAKERATFERGARDRVRALMTAIDAQLYAVITPLEVLASSPALGRGDLATFRAEAQRALEARSGEWVNVLLSHPATGEMLVNLHYAPGEDMGPAPDPHTIIQSAQAGRPTVSRIAAPSPKTGQLVFAVRVPVMRQGKAIYVVSALVDTAVIGPLIDAQGFPPGWAAGVIDGAHRFVARRPEPQSGSASASASLIKALEGATEGWQQGRLLDGTEIYRAFRRSAVSAWSASIAVPRAVVDESLRGVWLLVAGFAAAAALGLWIAWRVASRISGPIAALAAAAPAVARGEAGALPPPGTVNEVRMLSAALADAARTVREREERQRAAEQALRAADRAKDEFLAMLGHELRNPLASVSNAAQLLRLAREQPGVLDNVSAILGRQVEHMTRLVDDLLEVGRVTGGKVRLERAPVDLAQAAREVLATWRADGRFRYHEVSDSLEPAWALADRARIEQVLTNLLDNALKYTPAGGAIALTVRARDGKAILEVSDSGEGMPPELIGRVFDLFVQGERSLARQPGGLGIGLTMAKRLAELHGGTMRAESAGPGKGARFVLELPAIERPAPVAAASSDAPAGAVRRRILVVEDNRDARETLTMLLRAGGHEVHAAESGAQGLEMAASLAPALTLVDIGLPDIDGYELARRLRQDPATRGLRLAALTGYGTAEDRRLALDAGFDQHLTKPAELAAIEALLRSLPAAA